LENTGQHRTGQFHQPEGGFIIEADVQYGIHHAGYGKSGTGAARHQQRIFPIAKPFPALFFDGGNRLPNLRPHSFRKGIPGRQIGIADLGGYGKTGRHRPRPLRLRWS
jgi:hypothetical protein